MCVRIFIRWLIIIFSEKFRTVSGTAKECILEEFIYELY
jgi:hypothetical protein